jgi:TRAP transporter 4TM/12TM fusion protein
MPAPEQQLTQREIEELVEKFEGSTRNPQGIWKHLTTLVAVGMSAFALYTAVETVNAIHVRAGHLLFALALTFLLYPAARRFKAAVTWFDLTLIVAAAASVGYVLLNGDELQFRAAVPERTDLVMAVVCLLVVLECTRRTAGPAIPLVAVGFFAYALWGNHLPQLWSHPGYDIERTLGYLYMYPDGVFGLPIDVSSTFIILFTIFGAVLEHSGAGDFFVRFALSCTGRTPSSAGRTVTLASFLLGTVSGSGVATTVTLGSIAYPMLKKAGYDKESAGGMLAAGGIGAVISPPVLGAASFLIAEILNVSYLNVLLMAAIPTILYYLSILLMVEFDSKRKQLMPLGMAMGGEGTWSLTRRYWFHFASLVTIVVFMALGFSATRAVIWSTLAAVLVSYLTRDSALWPSKLIKALEAGARGVVPVAATCACAGIIVGTVTMTGLGLKFSTILVTLAGGSKVLALLYTAFILLVLGLALPITASYIIAAVITAPALVKLGVPDFAAHMFIFYYSVLSEVSPPTALSPFAAAALTGGSPFKTMMLSWKYTLPAFLVPFAFTTDPAGVGLLLKGSIVVIGWEFLLGAAGVLALASAIGGWMFQSVTTAEKMLLGVAGVLLFFGVGTIIQIIALGVLVAVAVKQWVQVSRARQFERVRDDRTDARAAE